MSAKHEKIRVAGAGRLCRGVRYRHDQLRFAPGSGTLVRGGTTYRECHLALEIIAEHGWYALLRFNTFGIRKDHSIDVQYEHRRNRAQTHFVGVV